MWFASVTRFVLMVAASVPPAVEVDVVPPCAVVALATVGPQYSTQLLACYWVDALSPAIRLLPERRGMNWP